MLTMFTNSAAMSSTTSMNKANSALSTAMQRLGTGKRINSAADDAAGLQIATRLDGQSRGMAVAQGNISKAGSMLQTAEGAFDEVSNILFRMKDLATQAADDTNNKDDRDALQSEFDQLNAELGNIMNNTSYGTEKLFAAGVSGGAKGKMTAAMQFQIGASADEVLKVDFSASLTDVGAKLKTLTTGGISSGAAAGNTMLKNVNAALDSVGGIRSELGANINRLGHTSANLANMKDNTDMNIGTIRDADFAEEGSKMSRQNMLMQSSQMMLKQANGMGQMVLGMLG